MLSDELTIVSKIQKHLKDNYHSIGENMMAGGVDNMENISICWDRHTPI